jgi:hypothetical protein
MPERLVSQTLFSSLALLTAAADSPFASHRIPTLQRQWLHLVAGGDTSACTLSEHLAEAEEREPEARDTEDWWPSDPRFRVCYRLRGRRWRLHPGRQVDPLDLVETMLDVGEAIASACEARHGFMPADLIEAAMRYVDGSVSRSVDAWPEGDRDGPTMAPSTAQLNPLGFGDQVRGVIARVSEPEVAVARRWLAIDRLGEAAAASAQPERAQRAIEWATATPISSDARWHGQDSVDGPFLAVRSAGRRWPMPASFVLAYLRACVTTLAEEGSSAATARQLTQVARRKLDRLLYAKGLLLPDNTAFNANESLTVAEPSETDPAPTSQLPTPSRGAAENDHFIDPHHVLILGRRLVTIDIVPALNSEQVRAALDAAVLAANSRTPEALAERVPTLARRKGLIPLRLFITHGLTEVMVAHTGGCVVMTLPVLRRILRDADNGETGRDEVWQFIDDVCRPPSQIELLVPAAADDIWTHWRTFGGLLPSHVGPGQPRVAVLVAPTLFDVGWEQAAALEPVSQLADTIGLPQIGLMPSVFIDGPGCVSVISPDGADSVFLGAPSVVIAVNHVADTPMGADPLLLDALGAALRDALSETTFGNAMAGSDGVYRLVLMLVDDLPNASPAALDGHPESGWELTLTTAVLRLLAVDPRTAHVQIGSWLATPHRERAGLPEALARWRAAPPFITLDSYRRPVDAPRQTKLLQPNRTCVNRAWRAVAAAIPPDAQPAPGTYTGMDAVTLTQDVVFPAIIAALRQQSAEFAADAAISVAVAAADAAHAQRASRRRALQIGLRRQRPKKYATRYWAVRMTPL